VLVEELDNTGPRSNPTYLPVHRLIACSGRLQDRDITHLDLMPLPARNIAILGRILPLPDGCNRTHAGDHRCIEGPSGLLITTPQCGGLHHKFP
jgi:hypothetical protein